MATTVAPAPTKGHSASSGSAKRALVRVRTIFGAPTLNAALLLGTTLFLVAFGLTMVLSSSSVTSFTENSSFYALFIRQAAFAAAGLALLLIASRMPAKVWIRIGWAALAVGVVLQLLVFTPLGFAIGGNRNWILIGGFSIQPSEFLKLALIVWMGTVLTRKQRVLGQFWQLWIPLAPVAGLSIGLVLLGSDFGTVSVMTLIVLGAAWFAGAKWWHMVLPALLLGLLAVPVVLSSASRVSRVKSFIAGCTTDDYWGNCWQQLHGTWALSAGGLFGVGLGNSRAKWNWLPAADNDYIFAIIGEELGLIGAIVVLALYGLLAYILLRIVRDAEKTMTRVVCGAATVWLVGQAIVNIAVVLGMLPVLGVPLPLISAGGSQLIATLLMIGIVLSLERSDNATVRTTPTPAVGAQRG